MSSQTAESGVSHDYLQAENLKIWSCTNCRRRKVRCDRRHPCAPCIRNKSECIFPVSGRVTRRGRPAFQKQTELLGRLRRLESMVGDLGSQVEHATAESLSSVPVPSALQSMLTGGPSGQRSHTHAKRSRAAHDGLHPTSGVVEGCPLPSSQIGHTDGLKIAENGDLIVGDGFWSVFCKEVEHIFEAIHGPMPYHPDKEGDSSAASMASAPGHVRYYSFLVKNAAAARQQQDLYPLPSQMPFLWQIYVDNIDPFMKVLHIPSMTKVIREMRGSYQSLDVSMQAVVLAMSLAAVMSLSSEEVRENFKVEKDDLMDRYRLSTEQALQHTDFLNDPNTEIIKALIIYLGVLQHTGEMKPAWPLAGMLVRVAVTMKLHQDGSRFSHIRSFEVEMSRRLWWQICFVDSRSADSQASQYNISETMFDTKIPENITDAMLDPNMSYPAISTEGWTDTTVCRIHCELWKLSHRLRSVASDSIREKVVVFRQFQAIIENSYLRHSDPSQPFHSFVVTITRLFLNKVDLFLHSKQNAAADREVDDTSLALNVLRLSVTVIEYTHSLQSESRWQGWMWQVQRRHPPWHALTTVLRYLCTSSWIPDRETVWLSVKRSFDNISRDFHQDPCYQKLVTLVRTVQSSQRNGLQPQSMALAKTVEPVPTAQVHPIHCAPIAQSEVDKAVLSDMPRKTSSDVTDIPDDYVFNDLPSLDVDWQMWDEFTKEVEPAPELWDMLDF